MEYTGRGRHWTFFQVGVCGPDFLSVGLANWFLPLKRGSCESLRAKLWPKIEAVAAKLSKLFSKRGSCELKFFWQEGLVNGTFANYGKVWKGGGGLLWASHPYISFLGHCPLPQYTLSKDSARKNWCCHKPAHWSVEHRNLASGPNPVTLTIAAIWSVTRGYWGIVSVYCLGMNSANNYLLGIGVSRRWI